jgi:oligosaccharide repeat unit polymerase
VVVVPNALGHEDGPSALSAPRPASSRRTPPARLLRALWSDDSRPRPSPSVWWISPVGATLLIVPWTLLLTWNLTDVGFRLGWRAPKLVTNSTLLLYAAGVTVMLIGATIPQLARPSVRRDAGWPGFGPDNEPFIRGAARVLFWLTMVGYAAFALSGIRGGVTPAMIVDAVIHQSTFGGDLKQRFSSVAGITTLTQVGIAFVVVAAVVCRRGHGRDRLLRWQLGVVLALGLARAYLFAERLAILELAVPLATIVAMRLFVGGRRRTRVAVALLPIVLLPAMVAVFGAFEYSRSWNFYRQSEGGSFPVFAAERFAGYYATAYNNGQLALDYDRYPGRLPFATIEAFWTAPGMDGRYVALSGRAPMGSGLADPVLAAYANPEFNNPGGVAAPFVDYGDVGGLVFFFLAGLCLGVAYRGFVHGRPSGVLLYPVLVTGVLELPRYI